MGITKSADYRRCRGNDGERSLTKAEKLEIKTLANPIFKEQDTEIKQMADWKAKWSK